MNVNSGNDLCDFVHGEWWEPTKQSSSGKTVKLNNTTSSLVSAQGDLITLGSLLSKGERKLLFPWHNVYFIYLFGNCVRMLEILIF